MGLSAAGALKKPGFWSLENYYLKQGTQMARLHEFLQRGVLPSMKKVHAGPVIVMEAMVAQHMPQVALVMGYESMQQFKDVRTKAMSDPDSMEKLKLWESASEQPFEHMSMTLLDAAPYSPEVAIKQQQEKPRIFELRVYHSPSWSQLRALHERFAGPETKIFARVGVHPIFYSTTVAGANMPNLTYLIPFDNLAAREKAWDAFGADPEWIKVRKESIDKYGQISSVIQISIFKAAAYSPVG